MFPLCRSDQTCRKYHAVMLRCCRQAGGGEEAGRKTSAPHPQLALPVSASVSVPVPGVQVPQHDQARPRPNLRRPEPKRFLSRSTDSSALQFVEHVDCLEIGGYSDGITEEPSGILIAVTDASAVAWRKSQKKAAIEGEG
ncbi:hypothetical protein NDU88_000630 [Pleurodeles waltl]|uniref:Uncharacterized protein n=1 Tax=Pleurodeles waltl TaxID=8319 RepID=A0AAV7SAK6_PLEWA|nr:hypothetical protein NDU88_000630 [Pleurodeles waltl]